MTTLNTIIEEEKKEYKVFDCFEDGCGECEVCEYLSFREWAEGCAPAGSVIERSEIIEDYLKRKDVHTTTAMQRAYKQALDGVIQKATLKENPIEDNGELIDGSYYVIYKGYLDQLKK